MTELPTGTITFLFTDIEGSTRRWEQHPEAMRHALARHDALLRRAIEGHGGSVFKTVGDAFCAAFPTTQQAVQAAVAAQQAVQTEPWGEVGALRVRMALHTGTAEERDSDYFGPPLNRVARLLSTGHGSQILLSGPTTELVRHRLPPGASLRDLGQHRLKDLLRPEQVYQLLHPDLPDNFAPLKSLDIRPHNLPLQVTSFVGREREMQEVKQLLATTRLLTLTGSGGTGKTRLSLQVAADLLEEKSDGVWLVELAPLTDPPLVPQAVASALAVREEAGQPLLETLVENLKTKQVLLILDNCEHLLSGCAALADRLLRSCPQVQILASSRERLGTAGETAYPLPSLQTPDPRRLPSVEDLTEFAAVRLFLDRTMAAAPSFRLTHQNAAAVAQVCRRLDGIPLAIELAAARVKVLTVEQIAARLDDRFRLLTVGNRAALPRQQTLRAMIDWSYDLLSEPERMLLRRLAVFTGGWTLEAAEGVGGGDGIDEWEVLDLLTQLVDKSLVPVEEDGGGQARYHLLETVRQYSLDKLRESGEAEVVRAGHMEYFLQLTQAARPNRIGAEQEVWLARLETEHDNLRAALEWLFTQGRANEAATMVVALVDFWWQRGWIREGRDALARCLAMEEDLEDARLRAGLHRQAGWLAYLQADYEEANEHQERGLSLSRELHDREGEANALNNLALTAQAQGRTQEARQLFESSLAIVRHLGDELKQAGRLSNLGLLAIRGGEYGEARERLNEAQEIYQRHRDVQGMAACLCNLTDLALRQQDWGEAETLGQQSLQLFRQLEDRPGIAVTLANLAEAATHCSVYDEAEQWLREALSISVEAGLRALLPTLLEIRARNQAARGASEDALFCLMCAERLRDELRAPRSREEQMAVEPVEADLSAALGEERRSAVRSAIAGLTSEAMLARTLDPSAR
jgi:predicted ATPase/class 3 adenylate cyclase/uncharacterized protein HemY